MSKALYYEDAWMRAFDARVSDAKQDQDGVWLCLDRTAFYPEGGGQPGDSGRLLSGDREWLVADTRRDPEGCIWHLLSAQDGAAPPDIGTQVHGEVDWARRFDHMQQHTGEHIIAASLFEVTGGFTHGLHIGHEVSTIDVTLPNGATKLDAQALERIEALANARIAADGPVVCSVPDSKELAGLPLRKDPTVTEQVRICAIGDYEMVACAGTHLSHTSQVGLVKLLKSEPARGKMRLYFLCGERAVKHYALVYKAITQVAEMLSARVEEAPQLLREQLDKAAQARRELAALRRQNTLRKAPGLLAEAQALSDNRRLVIAELEEHDLPAMEALANVITQQERVIVLLCAPKDGRRNLLFARSADLDTNMSDFIKSTGAKGGGRPDFARGACEESLPWEAARVMAPHL